MWRWRSKLDWTLAPLLQKPLEKLDPPVRAALRAMLWERLELQTAPHAIGSDYAELMRAFKVASAAGFVNALARNLPGEWRALPKQIAFRLSVEFAHPLWLIERYLQRLGEDETRALLTANQTRAAFDVRANEVIISRATLLARFQKAGIDASATPHSTVGIRLSGVSSPEALPGWDEGHFLVQDEAAQLVGALSLVPTEGLIIDCASAPGGKATHLAARAPKTRLLACDSSEKRLRLVEQNARRLQLGNIKTRAGSWLDLAPTLREQADMVLLDAPCLGTGTFRRRPDAKWRKTPAQLAELVVLQRELLDAAAQTIKIGGVLLYSTCSLEPEENSEQACAFEQRWPNYERVHSDLTALGLPDSDEFLQTAPHLCGCDGAFAAQWRRKS
ncbi:ribosomal RNA small subunit methyltransferase B [Abditibacteriota bacterium]|nr:ribosomal RNA small subunit methyltransferase B [Abditibacteriota bacterium]